MNIGERKLKILQAIIKDYITTAQPVGSRTIAKKYKLGISSATIRNEMSDLEEMGLLEQPHTSAGRVPSERGYRLYVDRLMKIKKLSPQEEEVIRREFSRDFDEIEGLVRKTSKILSQLTRYTSLVMSPQLDDCRLTHIHFVPLDSNSLIAVIVTDTGVVKNTTIRTTETLTPDYLESLTRAVNEKFKGVTIEELNKSIASEDLMKLSHQFRLLDTLIPLLVDSLEEKRCDEIYADGVSNIFNFPEYSDINKAKNFLAFVEEKEQVMQIINKCKSGGIQISIGSELDNENIKDCSLVTTTYMIGGKVVGRIGIIGPKRMEYSRVVGVLQFLTEYFAYLMEKHIRD